MATKLVRKNFVSQLLATGIETRYRRSFVAYSTSDLVFDSACVMVEDLELADSQIIKTSLLDLIDFHIQNNGTQYSIGTEVIKLVPSRRYEEAILKGFAYQIDLSPIYEKFQWEFTFQRMPVTEIVVNKLSYLRKDLITGPGRFDHRIIFLSSLSKLLATCGYGYIGDELFQKLNEDNPYDSIYDIPDMTSEGMFLAYQNK